MPRSLSDASANPSRAQVLQRNWEDASDEWRAQMHSLNKVALNIAAKEEEEQRARQEEERKKRAEFGAYYAETLSKKRSDQAPKHFAKHRHHTPLRHAATRARFITHGTLTARAYATSATPHLTHAAHPHTCTPPPPPLLRRRKHGSRRLPGHGQTASDDAD